MSPRKPSLKEIIKESNGWFNGSLSGASAEEFGRALWGSGLFGSFYVYLQGLNYAHAIDDFTVFKF